VDSSGSNNQLGVTL